MSSLFSIIIPVFNTQKYVSRCIDSILAQTFTNFELILINDGSTDNSGEICNKYAIHDYRIKIFHQANKGLSGARNSGLEIAGGEWIAFVDSDDWIEPNYLETINRKIQLINVDLYTFGLRRLDDEKILYEYCPTYAVESNNSFLKSKYYKHTGWSYVFRNSIIKKWSIRFPLDIKQYTEDQPFLLKYISKCNNVGIINKILYNYYHNSNSITQQPVNIAWAISKIQAANDFLQFCKQNDVEKSFYEYPVKQLYGDFFTYYQMIKNVDKKEIQREYRKTYIKTLKFYPEFKKYHFFKVANYNLSLVNTAILLYRKKNQIVKKIWNTFLRRISC